MLLPSPSCVLHCCWLTCCVSLMFLFTSLKWRMATTEPQASVNGYMHKFIDNLPDDMICLICQFPACNPHQRDCCGKIFCKACLDEHEKHGNQCPNCRQNGKNFYDKRSERQIKSLKMSCENEEKGCKWQGELFNLDSHTKDCQYTVISCSNQCPEQVMRKDLELHLLNNCQLREHRCPTCNQSGPYQTMTTTHLDQCPETMVPCPNECGVPDMARKDLIKHRALCPAEEIQCGYPGCDIQLRREGLKEHDEQYQLEHLRLSRTAFQAILQNQRELLGLIQQFSTSR